MQVEEYAPVPCFLLKTSGLVQTQTQIIWSYIIYTQMSNWWEKMIYSDLLFLDTRRPVPDVGFDDIIYTVVDVKDD